MRKLIFFISLIILSLSTFAEMSMSTLALTSPSFTHKTRLPVDFTCDGTDISPELNWSGIPANTESFALIVSDPDAPSGTFYHWIVYDIPKTTTGLPEGVKTLPAQTKQGKNSAGNNEYMGACPPKGKDHHYIFTLYALNKKLDLPPGIDAKTLLQAMQNHITGKTELIAIYSH